MRYGNEELSPDEKFNMFQKICKWIGMCLAFLVPCFMVLNIALAKYNIWSERQTGMAELARAEGNRAIKVCEARAAKDSAICFAEAEVIRARGVAEANKIIGDSLKENEAYLRYRWIEGLQTNQMQVVYVPTEAGLPILEAGKRP